MSEVERPSDAIKRKKVATASAVLRLRAQEATTVIISKQATK